MLSRDTVGGGAGVLREADMEKENKKHSFEEAMNI